MTISKTKKRLIIFFSLVSLVLVLKFPSQGLSKRILTELKTAAYSRGVILDIEELKFRSIRSIHFSKLSALVATKKVPIPVAIDEGELSASIIPIFMLQNEFTATLNAYGGTFLGTINSGLFQDEARFDLNARALTLEKHPVFSGLSMDGLLSIVFKGTAIKRQANFNTFGDAFLTIELEKFNYSGGHKLAGLVELPQLSDTSLLLTLNKSHDTIWLKTLDLISNLGKVNGRGKCVVDKGGLLKDIHITLSIALSESGLKSVGGYLALGAGVPPSTTTTDWTLKIDGTDLAHLKLSASEG